MPKLQPAALLTPEEILAIQAVFAAMVGIPNIGEMGPDSALEVQQRVMVLASTAITASDARLCFSAIRVLTGGHLWAVGKLIFTLGDIRMRGREAKVPDLLVELEVHAETCGEPEPDCREFFGTPLANDMCFHLLTFWGLETFLSGADGQSYVRKELPAAKLSKIERRALGFAYALEGPYSEEPKIAEVRLMPPLFQVGLGALLMAAGTYRVTGDESEIDLWVDWAHHERAEYARMATLVPVGALSARRRLSPPCSSCRWQRSW